MPFAREIHRFGSHTPQIIRMLAWILLNLLSRNFDVHQPRRLMPDGDNDVPLQAIPTHGAMHNAVMGRNSQNLCIRPRKGPIWTHVCELMYTTLKVQVIAHKILRQRNSIFTSNPSELDMRDIKMHSPSYHRQNSHNFLHFLQSLEQLHQRSIVICNIKFQKKLKIQHQL